MPPALVDELGQRGNDVEDEPAAGVVVSRASCSEENPTSRRRSSAISPIKSDKERDSRSRLGTARCRLGAGRPGRRPARAGWRCGRSWCRRTRAGSRIGQGAGLAVQELRDGGHPGIADSGAGETAGSREAAGLELFGDRLIRVHEPECSETGDGRVVERSDFPTRFLTPRGPLVALPALLPGVFKNRSNPNTPAGGQTDGQASGLPPVWWSCVVGFRATQPERRVAWDDAATRRLQQASSE
jgi:hypothetical protein